MADTLTLQSTPATLVSGTVVELPVDAAGVRYPGGWCSYALTTGTGNWTFQIVDAINGLPVQPAAGATWAVTGTFWQATQPVSLASLPALPAGANVIGHVIVDSGTITIVSAVTAITNALPAGTNLLGKVGIDQTTPGTTNFVTAGGLAVNKRLTPTVTAGAYAAGQVVGGVQTLTNAVRSGILSGILHGIFVKSKGTSTPALTLYFFDTNPSNGTYTDNVALTWNAADFAFLVHTHTVSAADFIAAGSKGTAHYAGLGIPLVLTGTSLYVLAVATGAFTPASTSDYTIDLNILQD